MNDNTASTEKSDESALVGKLIYDNLKSQSTYVGAYKFYGKDTCLDGGFNLEEVGKVVCDYKDAQTLQKVGKLLAWFSDFNKYRGTIGVHEATAAIRHHFGIKE